MSLLRRHREDALLGVLALALSVQAAFLGADAVGDYPGDAGPAISALVHGDWSAFGRAHPAMGDLSLLIRAPFAALAHIGHPSTLEVYRWGALPCLMAVGLLGLWLAQLARSRGMGLPGQAVIVVLSLENPIASSALALGHPEELLTAALCIGALLAAVRQRAAWTAVLLGLALACKQWTLVAILPTVFTLSSSRVRALLMSLAVAALATVPEAGASPGTYLKNQLALRHANEGSTEFSWWLPLTSEWTRTGVVHGFSTLVSQHRIPAWLGQWLHSIIIAVDGALALLLARLRGFRLDPESAFALMAAVLLLRCTLDTETMPYYYTALLLDLLAWDAASARALPVRALCATALGWVLFERLTPSAIGVTASNLIYGLAMAAVFALLLRRLLAGSHTAQPLPLSERRTSTAGRRAAAS